MGSKLGVHHVSWIAGKPGSIDLGGSLRRRRRCSRRCSRSCSSCSSPGLLAGPDDDARLVTAWAAAIAAFVVFGKVLSPQYLTWLVPSSRSQPGAEACGPPERCSLALALTQPEYLLGKHGLRNQDWSVWVLLIRNAVLVATFALLYAEELGRSPSRRTPAPV